MAVPAFGTRAFWDQNALDPADEYVEWLASFDEFAPVLRACCGPTAAVVHVGCGISSLSRDMHDDGCAHHQLATDYSSQCMQQQQVLCGETRPALGNAVMDATRLGLRGRCVDVVVDKCTLDAMFCDDDAESGIPAMADEVRRVLRPRGVWLVLSLNPPREVVPLLRGEGARPPLLVACQVVFCGNGMGYAYTCKLDESAAVLSEAELRSASRGWLGAVHSRRGGLLAMSAADCIALDEQEPSVEGSELRPLLDELLLLPAAAGPAPGGAPGTRSHLESLAVLQLQQLGLAALPEGLGSLGALRTLDCRQNRLQELPAALPRLLPALQRLLLDRNGLEALPAELGALTRLQLLSATHNRLRALPPSWRQLRALKTLRLQGNLLTAEQMAEYVVPGPIT